jgi:hypothetical protein
MDKTGTSPAMGSSAQFAGSDIPMLQEQPDSDIFQFGYTAALPPLPRPASIASLPVNSMTLITPSPSASPFSLAMPPGQTPAALARRISLLIDDQKHGTANTKTLLDAATGDLPKKTEKWTPAEQEAHDVVQAARRLDTTAKMDLVSRLSGGSDTVASSLASQVLRENKKIGMGEVVSAWRDQPSTPENRGMSDIMSTLGTGLLALQVIAPMGAISPTLTNGLVNTMSAVAV